MTACQVTGLSCSELEAGDSMPGDRFVLFRAGKHGMLSGAGLGKLSEQGL